MSNGKGDSPRPLSVPRATYEANWAAAFHDLETASEQKLDARRLWDRHANFSNRAFGRPEFRGPASPLKHLEEERQEALAAIGTPHFHEEIADCFLLVLDAARRGDMTHEDLLQAADRKLDKLVFRKYPPVADQNPGEPVHGTKAHERPLARIYICGPMSGKPQWNFPAFDAARDLFRAKGWEVVSPADLDRRDGFDGSGDLPADFTYRTRLAIDLPEICKCQAICLLDGWGLSKGARVEARLGLLLGCDFYDEKGQRVTEGYVRITLRELANLDR